ncbi:hypothetical protein PVAP13_4NG233422 [Panicum virgatum]|uniref:Uncharacterized protein n=1 Tax=Panicum virgatum TaxID=38727 RepID=A0A8T0TFB2_PANVG|nr:hypothetical protein PVAP13_4NG233422 [Panicum virgatum]
MLPKKQLSGAQKRKKRKHDGQLAESQKGALHKFFVSSSTVDVNEVQGQESDHGQQEHDHNLNVEDEVNEDGQMDDRVRQENLHPSSDHENSNGAELDGSGLPIYDPRTWDNLDNSKRDILIEKGPVRELNLVFPKDAIGRHFSYAYYSRDLTNGESVDRKWLVYYKHGDKQVFLASDGVRDWQRLSRKLREHESSVEHLTNMITWNEVRLRLSKNRTIDDDMQREISNEKERWRQVLVRIVSAVKFLAKHNLAFRGSNEKLYQDNNGNFLGTVEMIAEFDPVMQEHIRRIKSKEIHNHYLGHNIQNELISLLAGAVKNYILKIVKDAKYFSMTLIVRCVNMSSGIPRVEEFFLGFLKVDDTSGLGLFEVLIDTLQKLDLNVADVRGQGYDNDSNMKGHTKGVHNRLLQINPKALYMPCACHSLNLTLCDMAKSCRQAISFFGVIQRIYALFTRSTKRWKKVEEVCTDDPSAVSDAQALVGTLENFEFIVGMVIWHDVLFTINMVSKKLQSKIVCMDATLKQIEGVISYFRKYRVEGFDSSIEVAKAIAADMDIEPKFPTKRQSKRKKQFDETSDEEIQLSAMESFRVNYFIVIVATTIASLTSRFEQLKTFEKVFGFLSNSDNLKSLDDNDLRKHCTTFAEVFSHDNSSDVDLDDFFSELKVLQVTLPDGFMSAPDILQFVTTVDCYPNVSIAYQILLTVPVTVASAERSFSKLKLLRNCLRTTMLQERLNGLAMCSIEKDILDNIDLDTIINDFASRNARRSFIVKD